MVSGGADKPHAVFIPYPAQGHVDPMLKLAKLLHHRGFHITFVNTEYNHNRLVRSRGPAAVRGLPDFRFEAIPDGLPPTVADATQDVPSLSYSTSTTCLPHFRRLLSSLNDSSAAASVCPPVSCIVSDGVMSFTIDAAEELGVPIALFWTPSACGTLCYTQYPALIQKGIVPFKDASYLRDERGYLETVIHWIPGIDQSIRLKDLPSFIRTTNRDDIMLNFFVREVSRIPRANAVVLNTFHDLESNAIEALSQMYSPIPFYTVGPLSLLLDEIIPQDDVALRSMGSSLWKEQPECVDWLDTQEPNSVVYVNFGSVTVMTASQFAEFAWGLAASGKPFLWIIRLDLVAGEAAMLPPEFAAETAERGMLASWCQQEQVLRHPSVGGFLTHSGWNSTLEGVAGGGVPVLCWPFFAEQQTNCFYSCGQWGVGMEIDSDVKRDGVENLVRELMDGEKGKEMRRKAEEWRRKAAEAAAGGKGRSYLNFEKFIADLSKGNNCNK